MKHFRESNKNKRCKLPYKLSAYESKVGIFENGEFFILHERWFDKRPGRIGVTFDIEFKDHYIKSAEGDLVAALILGDL